MSSSPTILKLATLGVKYKLTELVGICDFYNHSRLHVINNTNTNYTEKLGYLHMDYIDVSWASFAKSHFCNNYDHFNPEYIVSQEENTQLIVFLSVLDASTFRALVKTIRKISLIKEDLLPF